MDKPDRRIEKTRTAIYQALSDLLHEKSMPILPFKK